MSHIEQTKNKGTSVEGWDEKTNHEQFFFFSITREILVRVLRWDVVGLGDVCVGSRFPQLVAICGGGERGAWRSVSCKERPDIRNMIAPISLPP